MQNWIVPALIATALWGIVGILQKLGSNRINAVSLLVWVMAGYVISLPLMAGGLLLGAVPGRMLLIGIAAGAANGFGTWALFESLERGAKASVAIPLTALYPLVTAALACAFLAERLTALETLGVALAIAAGAMLSYEKSEAS